MRLISFGLAWRAGVNYARGGWYNDALPVAPPTMFSWSELISFRERVSVFFFKRDNV